MKKTNNLLLIGIFLISACQKKQEEQEIPQTSGSFKITASTTTGPLFKTGHTEGNGKIVVSWEKGDKIGLFTLTGTEQKNTNAPLVIEKEEDISNAGKNAVFSGDISQNVNWNMDLYAYYPHSNDAGQNPKAVVISSNGQVINGKESTHLAKHDIMVADPVKNYQLSMPPPELNFHHIMAIADFKVSLPVANEAIEIREIRIMRSEGKRIQTSGTVDITAENEPQRLSISSSPAQSSFAQVAKVENVTLLQGESFNAKIALLPTDWTGETITIYIKTSIGTYKTEKAGIKFEAGKRYSSELPLDNLLPVNIGDYYYADGTWSANKKTDKQIVGIVVYKGHEGGSSSGYVAALKDTPETRAKGDNSDEAIDVPEIPNLILALRENTPSNYYYNEWSPEPIVYGSFIAVEDWNGKQYAEMIKKKRNLPGYNKLYFLLKSVDFELGGVTDGPAAKGNWFTPSWTQLHALTFNYKFLQQRFLDAGGSFTDKQDRWSSSEPENIGNSSTNYSKYTVYAFGYRELNTLGNWKFRFVGTNIKGVFPIRPYLEF